MAGSTLVVPHVAPLTDEQSRATLALVEAAFADGMAVSGERQSHMGDPMGGAELQPAESTQQPYAPPEPGDGQGGVT